MSDDKSSTESDGKPDTEQTDDEKDYNLDISGLELMPSGVNPGYTQEKLPGQFDEHEKTLQRIEENWKRKQ